jgi:hypothetical protein
MVFVGVLARELVRAVGRNPSGSRELSLHAVISPQLGLQAVIPSGSRVG